MLFALPFELIGIFLTSILLIPQSASAKSSVNVGLQASFKSPPYLLELLETAAEENATSYFPILDRIAEGHFADCETDYELYTNFLRLLQEDGHIRTQDALSSFQFALSIHSAAPRIEAHYQYYKQSVEPSLMIAQDAACPVWVHFDRKQYCSPTLERAQQDVRELKNPELLPFDRIQGESLETTSPSVLYADITSPLFAQFHRTVARTARNGQTSYRIRYRPAPADTGKPLVVSGYGVELALKRTDYIVIDDREAGIGQKDEKVEGSTGALDDIDAESGEMADLKPLSSTELLGLGPKVASFILDSENSFQTLKKVSQDFPKYSSLITKRNVSINFRTEHENNRNIFLPAGYNVIWMNGMQIEPRQMNAFALLDQLRRERSLISGFAELGFTGSEAVHILSHTAITESKVETESQRYDYRDTIEGGNVIIWLNNIEKDKRYEAWPSHASAVRMSSVFVAQPMLTDLQLLQRTYPGQLPTVKRDIHNLIIPLDLIDKKDLDLLVDSLQGFILRKVPIRFGIVPSVNTAQAVEIAKVVYHLQDTYGLSAVLQYLEKLAKSKKIFSASKASFDATIQDRKLRKERSAQELQSVLGAEEYDLRIKSLQTYLSRLGADGASPPLFVNGVAMPRNDGWLQSMSSRVEMDLRMLQQQVYEETIPEDTWLAGELLKQAITHRNALIIPEDETSIKILNIGNLFRSHEPIFNNLPCLAPKAVGGENLAVQIIIVADLNTDEGSALLAAALKLYEQNLEIELLLLHNPSATESSRKVAIDIFGLMMKDLRLDRTELQDVLDSPQKQMDSDGSPEVGEMAGAFWDAMQPLRNSMGFEAGQQGIMVNGRVVGPIPINTSIEAGDFDQLLKYERSKRLTPVTTAMTDLNFQDRIATPLAAARLTSLVALSTMSDVPEGIYDSTPSLRMNAFEKWEGNHTMISTGDRDTASNFLVASIDPTSEIAQRWVPILQVLSQLDGVYLKLFLNPRDKMQELPIKRFYRHVLDSKPQFAADGTLENAQASFEGLPKEALLNLALDVPPAWLVAPKESVHDLDNIKLSNLKDSSSIEAVYELEHILIEGHSRDVTLGPPPRGVQLLLGTQHEPHFADTLIMANLGYFQFKANPGYWNIRLQEGRSQQIFNIDSAGTKGYSVQPGDESTHIALTSFQGKTLFPRLSRKPGQETEDVLEETSTASSPLGYLSKASKFASSLLSNAGLAASLPQHADINIFSVASGHLYERMLNIMMVSVMRHTKHTVKFWFIEQFLSPSFKASLPTLASHYNFNYEFITYKWPHWLRSQKEKQREIWGYKILFLDVLFPLSLDKVIFVDADQIVRTDMYDLVTHDLEGAPYGFTPMCDSRTSMEGFRFWKQGYWKSFLRGLPYHISALYVVDLKKFRQIAAGDRLRQQYHSLSADPNSLSNLDQDLPNHMQMQLPIHSLPQEWLWCETWCSDEDLEKARTIDLCNNPLTKEPKLERARRQVPEWTIYDEEIRGVLEGRGNVTGSVNEGREEARKEEVKREEAKREQAPNIRIEL